MKRIVLSLSLVMIISVVSLAEKSDNLVKAKSQTNAETELQVLNLSGLITDCKTGELLVGVEVCLKGTDMKTYSDLDGKFSFKNVKKGEYELVSSYISYKQGVITVRADQTKNQLEIKLQSSN